MAIKTGRGANEIHSDTTREKLVNKLKQSLSDCTLTGIYFFKLINYDIGKQLTSSWRDELKITETIQLLIY